MTLNPRQALYPRIALVFALSLLGFGAGIAVLGYAGAKAHQREVIQRISEGLAPHIVAHETLFSADGSPDTARLKGLFDALMAVNPSVEVYLLDPAGRVIAAGDGGAPLQRERVALAPVRALLGGAELPVSGDNPRNAEAPEVFTAAPVLVDGRLAGYLYIVLLGDMYRALVDDLLRTGQLHTVAVLGAGALVLTLAVGLLLFAWITRPLNRLTARAERVAADSTRSADAERDGDEIARLAAAFAAMEERIRDQVDELRRQDELRRELVANVSHDLRTPLTAMQNYLETLQRLGDGLSAERRRQYVDIATRHSRRVARLAQQLFELAQLECEDTRPQPETFCVAELLHDIAQKFALPGERAGVAVIAQTQTALPPVRADVGMIERVITNLVDNALRHTPRGGQICIAAEAEAAAEGPAVLVTVRDTGRGIAPDQLAGLFERASPLRRASDPAHGGLGLLICTRILSLHGAELTVASESGQGTCFAFRLMGAAAEQVPLRAVAGA